MNYRLIAWISLGLWLATVIVVAVLFVRGSNRSLIRRSACNPAESGERDLVLGEMRTMLGSVQGIVQGVHANDLKKVTSAARASAWPRRFDVHPALMAKLPLEFKQLGMSVHHGFDDLADAVDKGATANDALARLEVQLVTCVACHASFRVDAGSAR